MDPVIETRFKNVSNSKTFRNIVRRFDLDKKSVLDLGCSYGEFLSHFGQGSLGVTVIQDEVNYGKQKGLNIVYGNLEDDNFSLEQKFDVIFCNNMLEHLFAPHPFLIKIKENLKENGILILGVPCIPKLVWLTHIEKFKGSLAGAHINFFTKDTLIKTTERAGWDIVETRGFHFSNRFLDHMLDLIYPHFYVVAKINPTFRYGEKRMRELRGYSKILTLPQ